MLLVDGDPLQDPSLLVVPDRSLLVIVKDGRIFKNRVTACNENSSGIAPEPFYF